MRIHIETFFSRNAIYSFEIESLGQFELETLDESIISKDSINSICVAENMLFIRFNDRDFRDGANSAPIIKEERLENNITAYDWNGKKLWNIGEIVGDIKMCFDYMGFISPAQAHETFGVNIKDCSDILLNCSAGYGHHYIIDPINKTNLEIKKNRVTK